MRTLDCCLVVEPQNVAFRPRRERTHTGMPPLRYTIVANGALRALVPSTRKATPQAVRKMPAGPHDKCYVVVVPITQSLLRYHCALCSSMPASCYSIVRHPDERRSTR